MMKFANLDYMIYIIPAAVFAVVLILFYGWWRRHSVKFMFRNRIPENIKKNKIYILIRELFLIISILLFAVILLRPQWGTRLRPVTKEGSDLLIILDVSRSMNADDIEPSRLERAKSAVKYLSSELEGDRVALEIFAGESFLQCPFTSDIGAFHMFLDSISTNSLHVQGTDIGGALETAVKIFEKRKMTNRLVLLITDGEDHEKRIDEAVKLLKENDVKVYTASVGTSTGKPIPLKGESSELYKRDLNGSIVKSKTNTSLLKSIARKGGGDFIDLNKSFSGMKKMKSELRSHNAKKSQTQMVNEPLEQYQIFVIILFLFLLGELFIVPFRRGE